MEFGLFLGLSPKALAKASPPINGPRGKNNRFKRRIFMTLSTSKEKIRAIFLLVQNKTINSKNQLWKSKVDFLIH